MDSCIENPSGLILRRWAAADADELRAALDAEDAHRQLGGVLDSAAAATAWIERRREEWDAGASFSWAVASTSGQLLGCAAVSSINRAHDTGWVSYWTASSARRRGVATAATSQVARWAFDQLGLFRLELGHRTDNTASCRVASAAGSVVEGVERAKLRYGGHRFDVELHARLATDAAPSTGAIGCGNGRLREPGRDRRAGRPPKICVCFGRR